MGEISIIIRTADKTRKAEISISSSNTVGDIIQGAIDNWALPKDTEYTIVNTSSGKTLNPSDPIDKSGVSSGEILEIQPVLVAGR